MARPTINDEGLEKSAILMMTLDDDTAAEILKLLAPHDVQHLSQKMASLGNLSYDKVTSVIRDFNKEVDQLSAINIHSSDHIRSVLVKAMGSERAASILDDMFGNTSEVSGIDALNVMEPNLVAEMIRDEHPQIIATIIVHLDRGQSTDVLMEFDDDLRNDVVLRVATFNGVQPAALQALTEVLGTMLDGQNLKRSNLGGIRATAEILNMMNSNQEEGALKGVRDYDNGLAEKIIEEMFVFEDLEMVDDTVVRRLLQDVEQNDLALALKGAPQDLINRFTNNMASRAADLLLEDMEIRGPVRVSKVEAERKKILELARRLADAGEITLTKGDDEYV